MRQELLNKSSESLKNLLFYAAIYPNPSKDCFATKLSAFSIELQNFFPSLVIFFPTQIRTVFETKYHSVKKNSNGDQMSKKTQHQHQTLSYSILFQLAMKCKYNICSIFTKINKWSIHKLCCTYILDVLCCQPIKLFQVVSTSEFHEY